MGTGYICKCPECGYTLEAFLGVGMMYPITMREEIKKLKKGRYGEQGMRFFKEHPNGSITCENVVTRCTACGNLEVKYDFDLLAPRSEAIDENQNEPITNMHFDYEVEKYHHFCKKCGNKAEIVEDFEKKLEQGEMICPKCEGKLFLSDYLRWD